MLKRTNSPVGEPYAATRTPWFADRNLLQVTFLACLFTYGYAVANFSLHIDVEMASVFGSIEHTFALGRWGISLIHMFVLPEPVAPYFTIVLSLAFLSLAALVSEGVLEFPPPQRTAFVILYVSFPQFAYQLEFSNQSDCVAFGLFCASLSFALLRQCLASGALSSRMLPFLASVGLLVAGTSIYESTVFVVPVLCTLLCLKTALDGPCKLSQVVRHYGWSALVSVLSYGLCALIGRALQRHYHVTPSEYLAGLVGWLQYPAGQALRRVAGFIVADVMGRDFYGNALYLAAVASVVAIILASAWRRVGAGRIALIALLAVAALFSPFVIVLVLGEHQEPRTFVTEQIAFAGLVAMALSAVKLPAWLRTGTVAALVLVSCLHVSRLFFADTMAWTSDKLLGVRIVQEIYRVDPTFQERVTPLYFHGAYAGPNIWMGPHYNMFGQSFFTWDGGATARIVAFFKASGIADFKLSTPQQALSVVPALTELPIWPDPASVRLINGIMVVRLGP